MSNLLQYTKICDCFFQNRMEQNRTEQKKKTERDREKERMKETDRKRMKEKRLQ